ncbi:MAG: TetR/AcrR family transcriptional regulator, partial [Clostridia bacterium]|nr:TetR/AcrR family transcriptional regulator [Clostridia bacterium]
MKQENIDAKERIMNTMVELLLERKDVNKITTREVAKLANVNSASINYYYKSKDNLVFKAVEICIENIAKKLFFKDIQDEHNEN